MNIRTHAKATVSIVNEDGSTEAIERARVTIGEKFGICQCIEIVVDRKIGRPNGCAFSVVR